MAYTPSKHTTSNKPYGVQGLPDGARAYLYEDVNYYKYRPFISKEEVLLYFDTASKRQGHFSIIINTGGTVTAGVLSGGINDEYWFKDGISDQDLVIKQANVDLSAYFTKIETNNLLVSKVDKELGKGLSSNDYTTAERDKLAQQSGINTGDQDLSSFALGADLNTEINNRIAGDNTLDSKITQNTTAIGTNTTSINNINLLLPTYALDTNVVHKTGDEVITSGIKDFRTSPLVPSPTTNFQAMNLQKGRALPQDGVFSRNIGIIAKEQQVVVTAGYSKNFLQITPANNYSHIKLFITDSNSQVRAYEFQAGYDSLNGTWKQLTPYLAYQDRAGDFQIDIRAVDGFGPTTFGILFRVRAITNTSVNYRIEYHQATPAVGADFEDYTKLFTAEYLTTTQPVSGLYPFVNDKASKSYVDQQDNTIITSLNQKALSADVGDKTLLTTTTKTNLVSAINEVDARSKVITNSFEVVNLVDSTGTLKASITTDSNGHVLIKSATGVTMFELFQDGTPDDALIDPGAAPGFPYTFPFTLS